MRQQCLYSSCIQTDLCLSLTLYKKYYISALCKTAAKADKMEKKHFNCSLTSQEKTLYSVKNTFSTRSLQVHFSLIFFQTLFLLYPPLWSNDQQKYRFTFMILQTAYHLTSYDIALCPHGTSVHFICLWLYADFHTAYGQIGASILQYKSIVFVNFLFINHETFLLLVSCCSQEEDV